MEEQTNNKQTYEEQKEMREKARDVARKETLKKKRSSSLGKHVIWIAILLALVGGFYLLVKKELPTGEDHGVFYESEGRDHIAVGAEHPPYSSDPPSSGWHYDAPAPVGFYADPVPDERVIHNIEHGDIWIAYHPRVSEESGAIVVAREFEFDGKVIITPREENDTDIALVAWEWVDAFDIESVEGDEALRQRIDDFIKRHRNQGPENVNQPHVGNTDVSVETMSPTTDQ